MVNMDNLIESVSVFPNLMIGRHLHQGHHRLGRSYYVDCGTYSVFRETYVEDPAGEPVVLAVGFRLRLLGNNRALHWLFQRLCILTTPFWSGMEGFGTKLWMVSPTTHDYLGIYEWYGRRAAAEYINYLLPILRFFSVSGSVWYESFPDRQLDDYLARHRSADGFIAQPDSIFRAV